MRVAGVLFAGILAALTLSVWNNAGRRLARAAFETQWQWTIDRGWDWLLLRHLADRVAGGAAVRFRVTGDCPQRIAFVLNGGGHDLVRPRWVQRALASQQPGGGWIWSWHGWGPEFFPLRVPEDNTAAHPIAQGVWLATMLKYRYADWIARNYP